MKGFCYNFRLLIICFRFFISGVFDQVSNVIFIERNMDGNASTSLNQNNINIIGLEELQSQ